MDPRATLYRAADELVDGSPQEARDYLNSYRGWRARGGFEPTGLTDRVVPGVMKGDEFHGVLVARFSGRFPSYPQPSPMEVPCP